MTIHELLAKFPAERIGWQRLDESLINVQQRKGGYSAVTFGTREYTATDAVQGVGKFGIIVWVETEDWNRVVDEHKAAAKAREAK